MQLIKYNLNICWESEIGTKMEEMLAAYLKEINFTLSHILSDHNIVPNNKQLQIPLEH
jgi:hypothetical protein